MKPNLLDRAIGWIAPAAGARRLKQRAAMDVLARGYAGADRGRLNAGWRSQATSADAEIAAAAPILRDRMRDLVRNNPHAASAVSALVTHVIGDGIVPRANTGDARLNKRVDELFDRWARQCDAAGKLDFYGLQTLGFREMVESGDGLARFRPRRASDGLAVPLQVEIFETDLIDVAKEGVLAEGIEGRIAVQGIEFDLLGRRTAYWLYGSHPGNRYLDPRRAILSKAVPASEIVHLYEPQRTQVKGVPWGSPVLMSLKDLAAYEEAEIIRKKLEACMVGVLVGGEDDGIGIPLSGEDKPGVYDADGFMVERFEPGMFVSAKGGKDIRFNMPAMTPTYEAYKRASLHTIAAGFRVPYSVMTGDLTGVNYSSTKAGHAAFHRLVSMVQWQLVIPMWCEPIWRRFCETAVLAGLLPTAEIPARWAPPRFPSPDPLKDASARLAEVRAGFRSLSSAIAELGENPEEVMTEIAADNAKIDALSLVLDSDPRKTGGNGQVQAAPDASDEPPADNPSGA